MTRPLLLLVCHPFAADCCEFLVKNYAFREPIVSSTL